MSITADELAKVHQFYLGEGDAYSVFAEDLGREVERLRNEEAAAQKNEYVDRLAQIQYDAECDYALEHHGATLSEWAEATEFQRGVTTAGVVALLEAIEADVRLIPAGGKSSADVWDEGCEAGFSYAGNQSTGSGVFIDPPLNPYLEEPTEPESWDTWQEVPDGIEYTSHNSNYTDMWRNESGNRLIYVGYRRWVLYGNSDSPAAFPPFVRADYQGE